MEKNNGKLIVFSAPSGSGKTTLVKYLLSRPELKLAFSVSATSREKRKGETDGVDYYFLSLEAFLKEKEEGAFLESEEVYPGSYYGTLKSELERIWTSGKHVIFDIDVEGGLNIKKQFPEKTLAVFVRPPSVEVLENRLRRRQTESEEKIKMRVAKALKELAYESRFDVVIENKDLAQAQEDAYAVVHRFLNV